MSALKRVRCTGPGISRRRHGRGFTYVHPNGQPLRDDATRERIRSLAIPPAWEDVWICPDERGHLQAVGTDAAGRKQYLYHEDWTHPSRPAEVRSRPSAGAAPPRDEEGL